ncbi:MAG: tRNA (N(6)-L-threonylcarbamoyladenosine(37)-C(2))-methylthiotransferase MtaB [Planctomycetes bacterium]|jgi:threonylcarbamoyladenosine tRNA methylthiotransferase MtaB|nr:tRNA (N(6)-L-threonylcarbamoyladenosine(37)-C(2))-methylthiotransferase MtaB [Planctomycetota bacterium]
MVREPPHNVRFVTFGCKANQYDTQILRSALLRRGLEESRRDAELVVINTCTVTAEAGRKARQLVRRLARESPGCRIAVTGCLAESEPDILRSLPNVEWVLGNGEAKRPIHFLSELGFELDPEELGIPAGITEFVGHTRAFLKIQDGCDMACAFCIIPRVRGASRSRPAAELSAEVRRLLASGHREIVLCGIHIGHWGRDIDSNLGVLLEELAAVCGTDAEGREIDWRMRLSSIEATEVRGPVLEAMARHPRRIANHLHMPMQSGDDGVLSRMNRWYDSAEYLENCARIRENLDRPAFTADLLVGFPGEDERAFENTLEAVRRAGFARLHVFPFSPRPGTRASDPARLGGAVDPGSVRERRAALSELGSTLGREFRRSLGDLDETIVLEGSIGLCGRYQRVRVPAEAFADGELPLEGLWDCRLEAVETANGEIELIGLSRDEKKEPSVQ